MRLWCQCGPGTWAHKEVCFSDAKQEEQHHRRMFVCRHSDDSANLSCSVPANRDIEWNVAGEGLLAGQRERILPRHAVRLGWGDGQPRVQGARLFWAIF